MSKYFMGVDAGTHGVRVGITDDQGTIYCNARSRTSDRISSSRTCRTEC